jgi:hypothetical protein
MSTNRNALSRWVNARQGPSQRAIVFLTGAIPLRTLLLQCGAIAIRLGFTNLDLTSAIWPGVVA